MLESWPPVPAAHREQVHNTPSGHGRSLTVSSVCVLCSFGHPVWMQLIHNSHLVDSAPLYCIIQAFLLQRLVRRSSPSPFPLITGPRTHFLYSVFAQSRHCTSLSSPSVLKIRGFPGNFLGSPSSFQSEYVFRGQAETTWSWYFTTSQGITLLWVWGRLFRKC